MRYSVFRHMDSVLRKKDPIQLTVFLTRRCNARCPFCFYLSRKDELSSGQELTPAEYKKISANLGDLLWLAFSGGEIFLRSDLVDIVRTFYENNNPSIILLPTNGLLPQKIFRYTEEILASCPNSTIAVKLSLDGPEKTHDSLRGVHGAYQKVLFCYQVLSPLLKKYDNFELGINSVFCQANQDKMPELIELVAGLENKVTHTISLIRGHVDDPDLKMVDMDKYGAACKILEKNLMRSRNGYRFRGSDLKTAQDVVQRRLIDETFRHKSRQTTCYAGRLTAVLDHNGDIYPCESFVDKLGNVRGVDYDIKAVLNNGRAKKFLADMKRDRCFCTHECYMMMNILFNPRQYLKLAREYIHMKMGRTKGQRELSTASFAKKTLGHP